MLKFCLTVDCEKLISFKQGNPRWSFYNRFKGRINSMIKHIRYNEQGFKIFYEEIKKQKFPCTFMLTGKLFNPVEKLSFIEWGYHSYNHLPLTLLSDEKIRREVNNIFQVNSMTPPLWMVEDVKNPKRVFEILKENGYKNIVYKGKDDGIKCMHYFDVKSPEIRSGIKCVHLSNCFEGNFSNHKIKLIKRDILKNLDKEGVYVLSTHDFTHKNTKNLKSIIFFVKELEKEGKLKIINLKDA